MAKIIRKKGWGKCTKCKKIVEHRKKNKGGLYCDSCLKVKKGD